MKIKSQQVYLLLVILTIMAIACSKSSTDTTPVVATCDPNTSFSKTILPLFNSTCNTSGCHDGPNAASLNTFQVVHDNASQIRASISTGRMPKGKTLAVTDKNAILCWIDNGAKNN
ncbi:MAG: hypothetical protein EBS98_06580 [Chitinophagia bacterium]|nr:hypothetical protein [Chitinophagia bacterium]